MPYLVSIYIYITSVIASNLNQLIAFGMGKGKQE